MKKDKKTLRGESERIQSALRVNKMQYLRTFLDRHGKLRIQMRKKGHKPIYLKAEPLTPEFYKEYGEAVGQFHSIPVDETKTHFGSFSWLIQKYLASSTLKALDAHTQNNRRRALLKIEKNWGHLRVKDIDRYDIQRIRDQKADEGYPAQAINITKFMRYAWKWAQRDPDLQSYFRHNPFDGLPSAKDDPKLRQIVHRSEGKQWTGHYTWTRKDCQRFFDYWEPGTRPHICGSLMYWLGLRIGDARLVGPRHIDQVRMTTAQGEVYFPDCLVFTTSKKIGNPPKGVDLCLEIPAQLQTAIDSATATKIVSLDHFVTNSFGKPYSEKSLPQNFSKWASQAGLPDYATAHGLRKALATQMAEAGSSSNELKAVFGWTNSVMADLYTREAEQPRMAAAGISHIIKERTGNKGG